MGFVGAVMVPHPPIIIPEIGRGEEKKISDTIKSYEKAAQFIADLRPEVLIISSPHSIMYADYFHISPGEGAQGSFAGFGAGRVRIEAQYDTELRDEICRLAQERHFPAGTMGERDASLDHGTLIPLYFIRQKYQNFKIIRTGLSGLPLSDHYRLGQMVQEAADSLGRRAVWVASGDLSHKQKEDGPYGLVPEGPVYDARVMDVMGRAAFDELLDFDENFCEKAAECGHRSFVMMAGALDGLAVKPEVLSHEATFGVGYGVAEYTVTGKDDSRRLLDKWEKREDTRRRKQKEREDPYVKLARASLEKYVREKRKLKLTEAGDLPEEMLKAQAGVFVSLHEEGRLRGCIGTIHAAADCVAEEIIDNAVSAGTRDPRFDPVREEELDRIEYSVDILGPTEDIDSKDQLDVKRYGVIVSKRGRRGLLLPNLDGVDSVDEQIRIAEKKAGIDEDEKDVKLQRFEVVRHF